MGIAKINILDKKPILRIDRSWFPYRNIIDAASLDGLFCQEVECAIESYGKGKVVVYYDIEERDVNGRPTKILVGCSIKGKPHESCKFWFNTVYDGKPLAFRFEFGFDPSVDPFIFKCFMSPEDYISEDSENG